MSSAARGRAYTSAIVRICLIVGATLPPSHCETLFGLTPMRVAAVSISSPAVSRAQRRTDGSTESRVTGTVRLHPVSTTMLSKARHLARSAIEARSPDEPTARSYSPPTRMRASCCYHSTPGEAGSAGPVRTWGAWTVGVVPSVQTMTIRDGPTGDGPTQPESAPPLAVGAVSV